MKTKDVLKTGIERNFLRRCVKDEVITPKKIDSKWIVNKNYIPNEYSQEDVEVVWHAYLCRKIGLSYDQIKELIRGKEFSVRSSLVKVIRKYEQQIEEMQLLIEVMKYVKGIGYIPKLPSKLMGSSDFRNYLKDFIGYLDEDGKLRKAFNIVECISEIDDVETMEENMEHFKQLYDELDLGIDEKDNDAYSHAFLQLVDKTHLSPSCDDVQAIIHQIFHYHKRVIRDEVVTAWDFAVRYIVMLSYDSDICAMFKVLLGEETVDFYVRALVEFLVIQEPDKIKQIKETREAIGEQNDNEGEL